MTMCVACRKDAEFVFHVSCKCQDFFMCLECIDRFKDDLNQYGKTRIIFSKVIRDKCDLCGEKWVIDKKTTWDYDTVK